MKIKYYIAVIATCLLSSCGNPIPAAVPISVKYKDSQGNVYNYTESGVEVEINSDK